MTSKQSTTVGRGSHETLQPRDFPVLRHMSTRWADNDHYGHINNVVYYEFFDTAVNGWLMATSSLDIRRLPAIGVVAETSCRYLRELAYPTDIAVGIRLERLGTSSVTYRLAIFETTPDGCNPEACAIGRFVHVYVDAQTRRPVPIPEQVRTAVVGLQP